MFCIKEYFLKISNNKTDNMTNQYVIITHYAIKGSMFFSEVRLKYKKIYILLLNRSLVISKASW